MRLPTSSCLLGRHRVFLKPLHAQRLVVIPSQPASSLSAIHNGLRQSQKARPQGFKPSSLETAPPRRPPQGSRRNRDSDWTPPTFKIKRGKKDVTDKGPERQSRRSRFYDPTYSFGKRSLVYQMKQAGLNAKRTESEGRERSSKTPFTPRERPDNTTPSGFTRDHSASTGWQTKSTGDVWAGRASPVHDRRPAGRGSGTRTASDARNWDNRRTEALSPDTWGKEFARVTPWRTRHESSSDDAEQSSGSRNEDEQKPPRERENRKEDDDPIRIHHTTAASQFLYGRSVVQAALKDSRRQLYKLYIYAGNDRQDALEDESVAKLASRKGVSVTKVPTSDMRMMNKMSAGRPHNGYVLEASSLPQPPLQSLGLLPEDPKGPGFHVKLAHQSREEQMVNGTSDFVSCRIPKGRKPFVLLLDGILDPGNLGAILRTAGFLGVNAVVITRDSSATLTPVALKASAGASEVIPLFSIKKTTDFLVSSKANGWVVFAAVPATKRSRGNSHLTVDRIENYDPLSSEPTMLVIGSEGEGLTKQVRRLADHEVSIPGGYGSFSDVVDSLNVSVATGILCSAFLNKQSSKQWAPSESEDKNELQLW